MSEQIQTTTASAPAGPYSQAISANGFIFCSGQRPTDPMTGEVPATFAEQAKQVLSNLRSVLEAGGVGLRDVVKVNIYLDDISRFGELNEIYTQHFSAPYPARTTVACELRGIMVEIDAIAVSRPAG